MALGCTHENGYRRVLFALYLTSMVSGVYASCLEMVYLEIGVDGMIDCHYEDYELLNWSITGDADALIVHRNGARDGPGLNSGEYDLLSNGSLIIRNVSQQHERQYILWVYTNAKKELSSLVTVRVFVRPIPEYPVINGSADRQNLLLRVDRLWDMDCAMENVRPAVSLEWVISDGFPPNNLAINNDTTRRDHVDGTFSIYLRSHFKLEDTSLRSLTISCVVIGPDVLSSKTSADVIFPAVSSDPSIDPISTKLFPVIDGCYSQQLDCKQVTTSPTGRLTCTVMNVPTTDDVWMELTLTPLGGHGNLKWVQTRLSNASEGVSRSLGYSIDGSSGTSLLEVQCRLLQKGFENVIGSAYATIEVQHSGDPVSSDLVPATDCRDLIQPDVGDRILKLVKVILPILCVVVFLTFGLVVYLVFCARKCRGEQNPRVPQEGEDNIGFNSSV